jgi:hypothetical protein
MSHRISLVALVCCLVAGCNGPDYKVVPVSGRVTLDGQPLNDALVAFQPIGSENDVQPGPGSVAHTNSTGDFTLQVVEPSQPGAVVGKHRVTITTAKSNGSDESWATGERVPRRYRNGSLQFDVPESGTTAANFDLYTVPPRDR